MGNSRRATSLFQVQSICSDTRRGKSGTVVTKHGTHQKKLKFPETERLPTHLSNLDHVELLHVRACDFDVILHEEGGFSLDRPVLETARLFIKAGLASFGSSSFIHTLSV